MLEVEPVSSIHGSSEICTDTMYSPPTTEGPVPLQQDRPAHPITWKAIKAEHVPFIDVYAINTELELWQHNIGFRGRVADKLCKAIVASCQLHPYLYSIFSVLFIMPVSLASAER